MRPRPMDALCPMLKQPPGTPLLLRLGAPATARAPARRPATYYAPGVGSRPWAPRSHKFPAMAPSRPCASPRPLPRLAVVAPSAAPGSRRARVIQYRRRDGGGTARALSELAAGGVGGSGAQLGAPAALALAAGVFALAKAGGKKGTEGKGGDANGNAAAAENKKEAQAWIAAWRAKMAEAETTPAHVEEAAAPEAAPPPPPPPPQQPPQEKENAKKWTAQWDSKAAATSKETRLEKKQQLLNLCDDVQRGRTASAEDAAAKEELACALEAENPNTRPLEKPELLRYPDHDRQGYGQ